MKILFSTRNIYYKMSCERKKQLGHNNPNHCLCNCIILPQTYWFNSKTLKIPKRYKRMRKLVNCVEFKDFWDICDNKITKRKNYNNICCRT